MISNPRKELSKESYTEYRTILLHSFKEFSDLENRLTSIEESPYTPINGWVIREKSFTHNGILYLFQHPYNYHIVNDF